jgi:hypothetical protein
VLFVEIARFLKDNLAHDSAQSPPRSKGAMRGEQTSFYDWRRLVKAVLANPGAQHARPLRRAAARNAACGFE